jgi:hypothetical protein
MAIDHELMKSLEYDGPYGGRYTCSQCSHFNESNCVKLPENVKVSGRNNVCRSFDTRIMNSSAPEFNLDDYLEFLGSDFYRPWSVDTGIIVGESWGNVGLEMTASGGWTSKFGKITHYKPYDKPYCRVFMPRGHVYIGEHSFEIDYRLYRELAFIRDGEVHYDLHYWKDNPRQRKNQKETYGRWRLPSDQ